MIQIRIRGRVQMQNSDVCRFKNIIETGTKIEYRIVNELLVEKWRNAGNLGKYWGAAERTNERERDMATGVERVELQEGESEGQSLEIVEVLEHLMDTRIAGSYDGSKVKFEKDSNNEGILSLFGSVG